LTFDPFVVLFIHTLYLSWATHKPLSISRAVCCRVRERRDRETNDGRSNWETTVWF